MFLRFKKFIFSIIHIYLELTTESKYLFEISFAHFHNEKNALTLIAAPFFTIR
jgi:hypothetical protein